MVSSFEWEMATAQRPRGLAELALRGVTAEMTRSRRWRRSSRGHFVPADAQDTTAQRVLEAGPLVPPGGALAGWAAAYALGTDLLDGRDPHTMDTLPVPVHLGPHLARIAPTGCHFLRERLPPQHVTGISRLPVTTPLRTAFDGGRWAPDVVEAVVFLDQLAHALELELAELTPWCAPGDRWPGIKQLRQALALAEAGSESPWESRLRMFYLFQAGLPRPLVNRPVFDLEENFLGRPDLFDPEAGFATEFDGKGHRERDQHRADNLREERLEGTNLTVCRVDSLDLRQPRPLRERLRSRHAQGLRRDRSQDRWTLVEPAWWRRRRRAA